MFFLKTPKRSLDLGQEGLHGEYGEYKEQLFFGDTVNSKSVYASAISELLFKLPGSSGRFSRKTRSRSGHRRRAGLQCR